MNAAAPPRTGQENGISILQSMNRDFGFELSCPRGPNCGERRQIYTAACRDNKAVHPTSPLPCPPCHVAQCREVKVTAQKCVNVAARAPRDYDLIRGYAAASDQSGGEMPPMQG
jgi:hypothetical protein